MPCLRCGRNQTDPRRGERAWIRLVRSGDQFLACPECVAADPKIMETADRCERCSSTRLSKMMGSVVCRECGHQA